MKLTGFEKADALDTLSAAYAEAGNFEKAIEYQKRAIEIVAPHINKEFQERLQIYSEGRAFRE